MTPDELTGAARNLAHGLGIPVYIRDGRIYQQGPGLEFLPPGGAHPMAAGECQRRREDASAGRSKNASMDAAVGRQAEPSHPAF